eukprot:m.335298 g.335298  ORF g.335298 m.335298 type:complete len:71 (-) comp20524_c1_seq20:1488-1700(-)
MLIDTSFCYVLPPNTVECAHKPLDAGIATVLNALVARWKVVISTRPTARNGLVIQHTWVGHIQQTPGPSG